MSVEVSFVDGYLFATMPRYDLADKTAIESVAGGRFVGEKAGGPGWKFSADMQTATSLRRALGERVVFSQEVVDWGRVQKEKQIYLNMLSSGEDYEHLPVLEQKCPQMAERIRPFQRVGVQFVTECANPLIADEPGLGKTWEVIGGIIEAGLNNGPNLIICPKISIESVWLKELSQFVEEPIFVAPEGRKERLRLMEEISLCSEDDTPFWLVVNPAMVGLRRSNKGDGEWDSKTGMVLSRQFDAMFDVDWNCIVIDEAHDAGIANPQSQFSRALSAMSSKKRIAMSGTPMGGKPLRLWGILHWLEPKTFTSKHRWARNWVKETSFVNPATGQRIVKYGQILKNKERQFYEEHSRYILRRKKSDVFAELPPKQPVDIWVSMSNKQKAQYKLMEEEAMAQIMKNEEDAGYLAVPSVLTINSWLKQFANSYCELIEKGQEWNPYSEDFDIKYKAKPTLDSPKLDALWEIIKQVGVDDVETGEQVVIFSQFRGMAEMTADWLNSKGVKTALITGAVSSRQERADIQDDFQSGGVYQAIVMTTKAGGTSINLDMANTVVFLDETWNPDDQEQGSDRCHRASRIHRVTVYTLRTKDTIEEEVYEKTQDKKDINEILLDRYRKMKGSN